MARTTTQLRGTGSPTWINRTKGAGVALLMIAAGLAGCGGTGGTSMTPPAPGNTPAAQPEPAPPASPSEPAPPASPSAPANRAPTISGTPPASATVDEAYRFVPAGADADGDTLTWQIANRPDWASFDAATGRLSGTPRAQHVGSYRDVRVSATDGRATASLAPFTITVDAIATGQATLSWTPPARNADGSTLSDLSGYRVYYGRAADALDEVLRVSAGLTSVVIENLTTGTWYFTMTALNSKDVESERTATVSKDV